jgi:hypothetical protein
MSDAKEQASATGAGCGCKGAGPVLSEMLRKILPDENVRVHFRNARIEVLKGIRTLIDQRIEHLSQHQQPKGSKIVVE